MSAKMLVGTCNNLADTYNVKSFSSWGTLPKQLRRVWESQHCNQFSSAGTNACRDTNPSTEVEKHANFEAMKAEYAGHPKFQFPFKQASATAPPLPVPPRPTPTKTPVPTPGLPILTQNPDAKSLLEQFHSPNASGAKSELKSAAQFHSSNAAVASQVSWKAEKLELQKMEQVRVQSNMAKYNEPNQHYRGKEYDATKLFRRADGMVASEPLTPKKQADVKLFDPAHLPKGWINTDGHLIPHTAHPTPKPPTVSFFGMSPEEAGVAPTPRTKAESAAMVRRSRC
jgi:hypothetical protein